jgi:hypothetical protein
MPVHMEDVVFGSLLHALMRIARALCLCITARSGVLDVHVPRGHCALSRTKPVHVHEPCSSLRERCVPHIGLRRSAAIHVHRRSALAAPVLSASRRVTKTARSGVLDVHAEQQVWFETTYSARAHRERRFVRSLLHALMWIVRALFGRLYGRCVFV